MPDRTRRLSRQDWIAAGLEMISEDGIDRLAVEPLARRLGSTKGSFYWHFKDLAALLAAILEHWRVEQTELVITEVERLPLADRLTALLDYSTTPGREAVTLAVIAGAGDPRVAPVVTEVQRLRIAYLTQLLEDRGLSRVQAQRRAHVAYAAYLGNMLLTRTAPPNEVRRVMVGYRTELLLMLEK